MDVKTVFLQFLLFECFYARYLMPNLERENVEIEITELTSSGRNKRSVDLFPSKLTVVLKTRTEDVSLNLNLVKKIVNTPTLITLTEEGLNLEDNLNNNSQKALYKDDSISTFTINRKEDMSVDIELRRNRGQQAHCKPYFISVQCHGSFIRDEELYYLQPASNNDTYHQLFKVDGGDLEYTRDYMAMNGVRNNHINRHRRSTGHRLQDNRKMYIEYVVVTDYKLYQKWYKDTNPELSAAYRDLWTKYLMMEFYHHIINGMDIIFQSSRAQGLDLNLVLAGIVIANTSKTSIWTAENLTCPDCDTVDDQNTLLEFAKWRREKLMPRLNHDHATLFTGYDLYYKHRASRKTVGLSYISKMCSNWSVSVVEDHRNALTSHVAAHELGHSLGAGHDGRLGLTCTENGQYLMAPKMTRVTDPAKAHNPWIFSKCSINDMLDFIGGISRKNRNCLLNNRTNVQSPFKKVAGQTYSVEDQCKLSFGARSSVCREQHYHDWTAICYGLSCRDPDTQICQTLLPHEGTICGNKKQIRLILHISFDNGHFTSSLMDAMIGADHVYLFGASDDSPVIVWCRQGICIHSDYAAATNETCPFGDDPSVNCTNANCTIDAVQYGSCCDICRKLDKTTTDTLDTTTSDTSTDNFVATTASTQIIHDIDTTTKTTTSTHVINDIDTTTKTTASTQIITHIDTTKTEFSSSTTQVKHTTPDDFIIFATTFKKMELITKTSNINKTSTELGLSSITMLPIVKSDLTTLSTVNKIQTTDTVDTRDVTTTENKSMGETKLNHTTLNSDSEKTSPGGLFFTLMSTIRAREDITTTNSEPLDISTSPATVTVQTSSTLSSNTLYNTTSGVEYTRSVAKEVTTTTRSISENIPTISSTSKNILTSNPAFRDGLSSVNSNANKTLMSKVQSIGVTDSSVVLEHSSNVSKTRHIDSRLISQRLEHMISVFVSMTMFM